MYCMCVVLQCHLQYLNGTWDESIAGKRFPPRLNYSEAFIKVGACLGCVCCTCTCVNMLGLPPQSRRGDVAARRAACCLPQPASLVRMF